MAVGLTAEQVEPRESAAIGAEGTTFAALTDVAPAMPDPEPAPIVGPDPVPIAELEADLTQAEGGTRTIPLAEDASTPIVTSPTVPVRAASTMVRPDATQEAAAGSETVSVGAAPQVAEIDSIGSSGDLVVVAGAEKSHYDSLLQFRLAKTREWLQTVSSSYYSIQLMSADVTKRHLLEAFLRRRDLAGELDDIYVYQDEIGSPSENGAREWFAVLYHVFPGYRQAKRFLDSLPEELSQKDPFVRNISDFTSLR